MKGELLRDGAALGRFESLRAHADGVVTFVTRADVERGRCALRLPDGGVVPVVVTAVFRQLSGETTAVARMLDEPAPAIRGADRA